MFNAEDYNENVEYCHYVFDKNEEIGLGLKNNWEIQLIANEYAIELLEQNDGIELEELYEDDELLIKTVTEYRKREYEYEIDDAAKIKYEKKLVQSKEDSDLMQVETKRIDRVFDFTDEYDDYELDEANYTRKR